MPLFFFLTEPTDVSDSERANLLSDLCAQSGGRLVGQDQGYNLLSLGTDTASPIDQTLNIYDQLSARFGRTDIRCGLL